MWSIVQLERNTTDGLVITAHWQATLESEGRQARVYGSVTLPAKETTDPTFVPFEEITEEIAIQWVKNVLGEQTVAEYEESLESQLSALLNPPTQTGLPWV
jgi:hypothetical protein